MSEFTKGKWVFDSIDNSIGVAGSDGEIIYYIAELYNEYCAPQEVEANARLIIAAPEMCYLLYHALNVLPESESDLIDRIAETLNAIDTDNSEERSFSCERVFNQESLKH